MALVNDLIKIQEWFQTEVCDKIQLKLPDEEKSDQECDYELVTPAAFMLYTPSKDRLPPNVCAPVPSLCIRLVEGEHKPHEGLSTMRLIVNFCTWNPGNHSRDNFIPVEEGAGMKGYNQKVEGEYIRSVDGWQDVYNFVDTTLRTIESAEFIAGFRVVSEEGIKFGMESQQDGLSDFYPFWPAWISFTLQAGNARKRSFDDLL